MKHDCLDHLRYRECDTVEPHGERHHDEWYHCAECGSDYTGSEVDRLSDEACRRIEEPEDSAEYIEATQAAMAQSLREILAEALAANDQREQQEKCPF